MSDNSKLSGRFKIQKQKNKQVINKTAKFVLPQKEIEIEKPAAEQEQYISLSENSFSDLENNIKELLLEKIETIPVWFEYTRNMQMGLVRKFVENKLAEEKIKLSSIDRDVLIDNIYSSITDFGAVQYLLDNEKVSAVFINGTKSVHIEIDGKVLNTETKLSEKQLKFLINTVRQYLKTSENKESAINSNLYNIKVIDSEICTSGINITIRKNQRFDKSSVIKSGIMTDEIFDFICYAISQKKNIVISGENNSGKTVLCDVLLSSALQGKRTYLLEDVPQINSDFDTLVKLRCPKDSFEYSDLVSYVLKVMPEYIVSDMNIIDSQLSEIKGYISTMTSNSVEFALKNLISIYMKEDMPEKYAKTKALTNFDYIIQLNRLSDGTIKLTSLVELSPGKTMPSSIKTIAKWTDKGFVTHIPQPITAMRSESLNSSNKKFATRFQKQMI